MHKPVSTEVVESVWQQLAQMTDMEAAQLSQQMMREQPELQTYLLAVDEEFTQDEQEIIYYLGVVLWQMMKLSSRRLGKVTEATIDKVDEQNFKFFSSLDAENQDFEAITAKMMEEYPEPSVFEFLVSAIMESDDPDDPGISDELIGLAFFHLKTALDAMIASLRG